MDRFLRKASCYCIVILFLFIGISKVHAQVQFSYPQDGPAVLNACDGELTQRIKLRFQTDVPGPIEADTIPLSVEMPTGLRYVPGSVNILSSTPSGYSISEKDISDLENPVFNISSPTAAGALDNDELTLSFKRESTCDAVEIAEESGLFTFEDALELETDLGTFLDTTLGYELLVPTVLTGSIQSLILETIQDTCRTVNIVSSGLGGVRDFQQIVVLGNGITEYELFITDTLGVETLLAPDSIREGAGVIPDTLYYNFDVSDPLVQQAITNADTVTELFANGELVKLKECFGIQTCSQVENYTEHRSSWNCEVSGGTLCKTSDPEIGNIGVIISFGGARVDQLSFQAPMCLDGESRGSTTYRIINQRTSPIFLQIRFYSVYRNWGIDTASLSVLRADSITPLIYDNISPFTSPIWLENECQPGNPENLNWLYTLKDTSGGFIPMFPSDTFYISFDFAACCESANECSQQITGRLYFETRYSDICSPNTLTGYAARNNYLPGNSEFISRAASPLIEGPATLNNGQCARFEYTHASLDLAKSFGFSFDSAYWEIETSFPPGLSYTLGSSELELQIGNSTNTVVIDPIYEEWDSMNRILVRRYDPDTMRNYDVNPSTWYNVVQSFEACLDCGTEDIVGGTATITQRYINNLKPLCPQQCFQEFHCNSVSLELLCPPDCDNGGGFITSLDGNRTNTCYADYDNNGIADIPLSKANIDSVSKTRILVGDTTCHQVSMAVSEGIEANNGRTWPNARYRVNVPRGLHFRMISAEAVIVDRDSLGNTIATYNYPDILPQVKKDVYDGLNANFFIELTPDSLDILLGGDPINPTFEYDRYDSIYVSYCHRYQETDHTYYRGFGIVSSSVPVTISDLDHHFLVSLDGVNEFSCNFAVSRFTYIGQSIRTIFNEFNISNTNVCANAIGRLIVDGRYGGGAPAFENESRNLWLWGDTVRFKKDPRLSVDFIFLCHDRAFNSFTCYTLSDTAYIDNGDEILFVNLSTQFQLDGGTKTLYDALQRNYIQVYYDIDCDGYGDFLENSYDVNVDHLKLDTSYFVTDNGGFTVPPISERVSMSYVQDPVTESGVQKIVNYGLLATNVNNGTLTCSYLKFYSPSGNMVLTEMTKSGVQIPEDPNVGAFIMGPLSNNQSAQYNFSLLQEAPCGQDSFYIIFGNRCGACPAEADDIVGCDIDSVLFFYNPRDAVVQLSIVEEPNPPTDICTPILVRTRVNSAGLADLIDPVVEIDLPDGVIINELSIQYPIGGVTEMIPINIVGNKITLDLTEHSLITDSLPGADPILGTVNADERQVEIILDGITTCEFISGRRINFTVSANRPCGEPATGNNSRVTTKKIDLGLVGEYDLDTEISIGDPIVSGCSDTADINIIVVADTTTQYDTTFIYLPKGLVYLNNSFVCNSSPNCPDLFEIKAGNGNEGDTLLLDYIPGASQSTVFDFDIKLIVTELDDCSTTPKQISIESFTKLDPLFCPELGQNGEVCPNRASDITGSDTSFVIIKVPDARFTVNLSACGNVQNMTSVVSGEVVLLESGLPDGDSIALNLSCSEDMENILFTEVFYGPIAKDDTIMFNSILPAFCDSVFLQISNENGTCICEDIDTSILSASIQIETSPIPPFCTSKELKLTDLATIIAIPMDAQYTFEWTSNGDGKFIDASGNETTDQLNFPAVSYMLGEDDLNKKKVKLKLLAMSPDCGLVFDELEIELRVVRG